jgi:hypothetical protein
MEEVSTFGFGQNPRKGPGQQQLNPELSLSRRDASPLHSLYVTLAPLSLEREHVPACTLLLLLLLLCLLRGGQREENNSSS